MSTFIIRKHNPRRGFIALISTILISAILIGVALTTSGSGISSRFDVLNSEYKRISLGLAESCANVALLKIDQNYNYAGNESGIVVGTDGQGRTETCNIGAVTYKSANHATTVQDTAVITASAQYPSQSGANSSVTISATVQNPAFAVPAKGSLTVVVNVVNQYSGTKQASDFSISVTGSGNPYPNSFSGAGGSGTIVLMDAGTYNVLPSTVSGYTGNSCSGTITAGASQVCTITENDVPTSATLTVIAQIKNDNGGTLQPSSIPLYLDGASVASGVPVKGLAAGTHTVTAGATPAGYTVSVWGTHCAANGTISLAIGDNKTCTIIYDDIAPPSPACADSVMILDRTGSMSSSDLSGERTAADALVNLYSGVSSAPKIGIGSIGAYPNASLPAGAANVSTNGQLSSLYNTITSTINSVTGSNSSVGSDLSAGINAASAELNSSRHSAGKSQVLILVSDGVPNQPSTGSTGNTGTLSPAASSNDGASSWSDPAGAYATGGTDATAAVLNSSNKERFSNFNFSIPTGATISGIEADTDAWATTTTITQTSTNTSKSPSVTLAPNQFTNPTRAYTSDNQYATDGTNGHQQGYGNFNLSIPTNATVTGVEVDVEGHSSSFFGCRVGAEVSNNNGSSWTNVGSNDTLGTSDGTATMGGPSSLWGRSWTPADFANGKFAARIQNECNGTLSADAVSVIVTYTIPAPAPAACQLGMDLSWNGGTSWTSEKTQTLTNTLATYVLGSSADDWSNTHNWAIADFSNANFRARVHAIDPGTGCDNAAIDHLDWLRMKVYYAIPVDPAQAALTAADAAKLAGVQIFTIHFGDTSGDTLLAELASGSTANTPHQPGSANDQSDNAASGNTGLKSASAVATPSQWGSPGNATLSDNTYATTSTSGKQQGYGNFFGTSVQSGADIAGVQVNIEAKTTSTNNCRIGVELSADGGKTFTSSGTSITLTSTSDKTYTVGGSSSLWGRSWLYGDVADGKFVVRLQDNCTTGTTLSVDQVLAETYYNEVPENLDGDNFFISPTSADMQNIFQTIGAKVCPAAVAPPPAPPPTKGTLIVLTHVINDNGGINAASDFTVNVTGLNASQSSFAGAESPGVSITLDPGSYSVDQTASSLLYVKTLGAECAGTINAGDVLTCTITDDDIPPPPPASPTAPPPPADVNIGSWEETP
jgi:hypothetical protein